MRKPRLVAWTAGPLTLALVLSACGGGGNTNTNTSTAPNAGSGNPNGAISIYGTEPETNMLPANATDAGSAKMQEGLYSKLVGFKPEDGATYNEVADSITTTDSKVWTIKLKKGFKFHDGTEVKAKNFVDAWNWGANGKNSQLAASFFSDIQGYNEIHPKDPDGADGPQKAPDPTVDKMSGLKVIDDLTFEVTLNGPFSVFPSKIGYHPFSPLPDKFFTMSPDEFAKNPIGNGPLKFVSRTPNVDIKLTRFDEYSGAKKVNFKDLTIRIYSSQEAAYKDLLSDNLDFMEALPPSAKAGGKFEKDLGDQVLRANLLSISALAVPTYVPAYQNPNVRKAISMAINREQITKTVLNNTYVPADGLVPEGIEGYEKGACGEACVYDPAKAKALWDTTGFQGKVTIMSNADGGRKEPLEAACNSIKNALGVECEFLPATNFGQFRQVVNSSKLTGLGRSDWSADYPSIENFLVPIVKTGGSSNDARYSNAEVDRLLDQASTTADKAASIKLYQQAAKLAVADLPKIPTWVEKGIGARSKKLTAAQLNFRRQLEYSSVVVK
ncbi:peptide ABC transporter substrate-binding protein [Kibdelosporangium aridum]|uniref:Oligopeptide transport system substrate-binding protein n=1 Tax=Kibdelosporangium aridum TaxID=2030 RepID=A0A1W2F0V6_KIBAR|nr:ABC transporter substrate-binding protein [Kibdelosporangium aridum]SMD15086.1 oligopeptide transport system substrate-binding protein [Kibdelosporangium aridum]